MKIEHTPSNTNSPDQSDAVFQEKLKQAAAEHGIEVSKEERERFDEWRRNAPPSSLEKPITVEDVGDILGLLPDAPNYLDERIGLYFIKDKFSDDELRQILEKFTENDPRFEISITRYEDGVIATDIGNKGGVKGELAQSEWFGHSHPLFKFRNEEELPGAFVNSLMPSRGDIESFFANPKRITKGTRIFSKNGFVSIKFASEDLKLNKEALQEYRDKYFDLFLGENKFGFRSNEELAKYLKDRFGLEIVFSEKK